MLDTSLIHMQVRVYSDKMPAVLKELKDKNLAHESRGACDSRPSKT